MTSPPPAATTTAADRDAVYRERDRLVAALSKCYPSHMKWHHDPDWEDGWRNIVCVHLPTGQATWHIRDDERYPLFGHLLFDQPECKWDGHSTDEKYQRLAALPHLTPPPPDSDPPKTIWWDERAYAKFGIHAECVADFDRLREHLCEQFPPCPECGCRTSDDADGRDCGCDAGCNDGVYPPGVNVLLAAVHGE